MQKHHKKNLQYSSVDLKRCSLHKLNWRAKLQKGLEYLRLGKDRAKRPNHCSTTAEKKAN